MEDTAYKAIAIVGAGAVMPDAPSVAAFWENIKAGRYCISEVPPERWDPAAYYDPDPSAPDKTYSKIGGWVREFRWEPMKWRLPIPPRVAQAMDLSQQWAVACTREALEDYGYPHRPIDPDRTAVILGNAMGGEKHYLTALRAYFPEYAQDLLCCSAFSALPKQIQATIMDEYRHRIGEHLPEITEDSMPGELSNCLAGRIANLFNFRGPNFTADAACASTMAGLTAAMNGLVQNEFDTVVAGGIDRNMGAPTFVKFCKIGALSGTGTRPYAEGADGFVMGEGAAIFILKRLADAERDGDKIYAVLRGIGGSSDGKGKGITAPNPIGQRYAVQRAWESSGLSPSTATMFEGHGTSTKVGDVVEVQSLVEILRDYNLPSASVALGSVKSNIGHLKGAAGAAGMLKAVLSLRDKVLPPSLNCAHTNPEIDFAHSPLYVNSDLKPWDVPDDVVRRAGLSAFGFGGTNFHLVLEEYIPGRLKTNGKRMVTVDDLPAVGAVQASSQGGDVHYDASTANAHEVNFSASAVAKAPLRGALLIGAENASALMERLREVYQAAASGMAASPSAPAAEELCAAERLSIDYGNAAELADKSAKALKALAADQPPIWKALRAQGIFRGHGPAPKVAFLYTGQGSQYVNMLQSLREREPIVAQTFEEADRALAKLLDKPLSEHIFVNGADAEATARAEEDLRQTAITQPAVIATDIAITRLLESYGIRPDMAMGHSVGEYGALVASGALPFEDAMEAVSARGAEMTRVSLGDNGRMAAVFAPLAEIEKILKTVDGYVVIANVNSTSQAVLGGTTQAVEQAMQAFLTAGYNAVLLPVSHAFHTAIVAGASEPLKRMLVRLRLSPPRIPIVSNVDGNFYSNGAACVANMTELLARQVAAPVQFVKGLQTLYDAGARVFVETGPKKALQGFAEDVLGVRGDVLSLFTNHPKLGDDMAFNQALCGLYAAGLGGTQPAASCGIAETEPSHVTAPTAVSDVVTRQDDGSVSEFRNVSRSPVVITGAALGLPGRGHIFDDSNIGRILQGEQFIGSIPTRFRHAMLDKNIKRLVKSDSGGEFEGISSLDDVIKLAGRGGTFDLGAEFGLSAERCCAFDRVTALAIAAGIDALRDAGIPLVMQYKTTSKGTQLPEHWQLPESMRDDTGVIFASAFPGFDSFADELNRHHADMARREQIAVLEDILARAAELNTNGHSVLVPEILRRLNQLRETVEKEPYLFDRRFLFKALAMGHSQFAELIGARGPNTQLNAACASTAQAVSLAEDWINTGRCERVIVLSADDVTSDQLLEWIGAGFLASGAAATDDLVENAALPFDRRRHGTLIGMGAAAIVIESEQSVHERGLRPICEVLSTATANSAFHGTRLDVQHITKIMEELVSKAEKDRGISRRLMADKMVFVSHETFTPARGGSASAEIHALRQVFGDAADKIVIANTKGFTGHAMAAGIEDVVAVKTLETQYIPPVANFKEVDPELGSLNLSKGGIYPVEYALRLAAGFGSQISMTLLRWVATKDGQHPAQQSLGYEYRVIDQAKWESWMAQVAGMPNPCLEVVHRTLRVRDAVAEANARPVAAAVELSEPQPETRAMAATQSASYSGSMKVSAVSSPPPATVPAPPKPGADTCELQDRILALVSEKTGYPIDMLDLDLDLEADLGVDTVKQAEIFATVRGMYGIARDDQIKLHDFPTLAHVIRFAQEHLSAAPVEMAEPKPSIPAQAHSQAMATDTQDHEGDVQARIIALVVEKTGYPEEMLDLDLDLEADLGIDTVKQAELIASIRTIYGIERDENLKLHDFPTLAHVIGFVHAKRPDLASLAPAQPTQPVEQAPAPVAEVKSNSVAASREEIKQTVLAIVAEKTGYPIDMLDLDLDLEADLGVDTVKQAEMFAAVRGAYNIPRDENIKLHDFPTLAHVIQFACDRQAAVPGSMEGPSPAPQPEPEAQNELAPSRAVALPVIVLEEEIREKVLAIVAEKTGYPKEMLDLDLDLEADLGVDTVKQAEMFAAVRSAYNIPRDEHIKLHDFPTLAHVIQFACERQASSQSAAAPRAEATQTATPAPAKPSAPKVPVASFEAANRIPRRVPIPVLRPPLRLCKPTGVALEAGSRVVLMPDDSGVADALAEKLKAKGVEVLRISGNPSAEALIAQLNAWMSAAPVQGVYWLAALRGEKNIAEMDLAEWREAQRIRVKLLYTSMRALYEQIASAGTFLISATLFGGQHGYDAAGAVAPLGGSVAGMTKTYKRERGDVLVKAVDFDSRRSPSDIANLLLAETLRDPGAVEVGYKDGDRWTVGLQEKPAIDGHPGLRLDSSSVIVVTGAAGSIVSAITADLASASGGTFYLLDLVPEPDPNNADLERFVSDKDGLKRELFSRIQKRGERATPALVERELASLERAQAAMSAIRAVRDAGGTAHYFSVNLTSAEAVAAVVDQIRKQCGKVDVLLHAAGMERSHFLPDKDPREFDLIFDVKSDGWFNLLHAIGNMPLGATVAFSSVAGRFGNGGQADYSSANDLLCKITSNFRSTRPTTRGIVIDWTAWAGIGMATRGSIPKMMEIAGIDMLPPEAGIPLIRRELVSGATRGEIVVGQRLGILVQEWDCTGGFDVDAQSDAQLPSGPMLGKITGMGVHSGLKIETTLDPASQPFLYDHQIGGTPVLPGVMGIEAFAETALALLPNWQITAIEDVHFLAPFKFYKNQPRCVTVEAVISQQGESTIADCKLIGYRTLPKQTEPEATTHFTGRVHLSKSPAAPVTCNFTKPAGVAMTATDIYRIYFHGPAYQVLAKAWQSGDCVMAEMAASLPPNHSPAAMQVLFAPRLIELCFQTAGLWDICVNGRLALPQHLREVRVHAVPQATEPLYAVASPDVEPGQFNVQVVDAAGNCYVELRGYSTIALPGGIDSNLLKALRADSENLHRSATEIDVQGEVHEDLHAGAKRGGVAVA